VEEKQ
jgi:hypothetical protein